MTKTEYLSRLENKLRVLPHTERQDALSYYDGYLNDAEDENAAIAQLGSPGEVAAHILSGYVAREPERRLNLPSPPQRSAGFKTALVITLAIFALPIGLPLIIMVASVSFALIITLASLVLAFGATGIGLIIAGIVGVFSFPFVLFQSFSDALVTGGMGLISIGGGILFLRLASILLKGFPLIARFVGKIIERRGSYGRQQTIQQ